MATSAKVVLVFIIGVLALAADLTCAAAVDEGNKSSEEAVKELTYNNFNHFVNGKINVFVEFFAPWCGHCKALAPTWESLGKVFSEDPDVVLIAKVDMTQSPQFKNRFTISGFPTLLWFAEGSDISKPLVYGHDEGTRSLEDLVKFVNSHTGSGRHISGDMTENAGRLSRVGEMVEGSYKDCEDNRFVCLQKLIYDIEDSFVYPKRSTVYTEDTKGGSEVNVEGGSEVRVEGGKPSQLEKRQRESALYYVKMIGRLKVDAHETDVMENVWRKEMSRLDRMLSGTDLSRHKRRTFTFRVNMISHLLDLFNNASCHKPAPAPHTETAGPADSPSHLGADSASEIRQQTDPEEL